MSEENQNDIPLPARKNDGFGSRNLTKKEKEDRLDLGREIIRDYDEIPTKKTHPDLTESDLASRLDLTKQINRDYRKIRAKALGDRDKNSDKKMM